MAAKPLFHVWEWLDNKGEPRYLGIAAQSRNGEHPADVLWDKRRNLNSDLGRWLQLLHKQPQRSVDILSIPMYHKQATAVAATERKRLRKLNVELLSSRPYGTKAGGGIARAVISPEGDLFESVRAAAIDQGVSAATITRLCSNPKTNWKYV